jgi:hypothetical protein
LQQSLKRGCTEAHNYFRLDGIELAKQERRAGSDFVRFGLPITGRAALDYIADVNVAALQAHGFDHLREKFSCSADEGQALRVFIGAGTFTYKHKLSFRISVAEDNFVARAMEFTAGTFAKIVANLQQRFGAELVGGVEERRTGRWRRSE